MVKAPPRQPKTESRRKLPPRLLNGSATKGTPGRKLFTPARRSPIEYHININSPPSQKKIHRKKGNDVPYVSTVV